MRRMFILIVLSILVVALSGPVMADQNRGLQPIKSTWGPQNEIGLPGWGDDEGDDEGDDNNGLGFGKKIAGTYEGKFRLAPGGPVLTGYQTYNLDGTLVTTDAGIYAGTNPFIPLAARQSFGAGHGVWEKVGPREAQVLGVLQGFYPACPEEGEECGPDDVPGFTCCDPTLTGTLFLICAPSGPYEWAPDYQTATGSFHTVCYLVPEDPDGYFTEGEVIFDSEVAFGAAGVATLTRVKAFDVPPPMNP